MCLCACARICSDTPGSGRKQRFEASAVYFGDSTAEPRKQVAGVTKIAVTSTRSLCSQEGHVACDLTVPTAQPDTGCMNHPKSRPWPSKPSLKLPPVLSAGMGVGLPPGHMYKGWTSALKGYLSNSLSGSYSALFDKHFKKCIIVVKYS